MPANTEEAPCWTTSESSVVAPSSRSLSVANKRPPISVPGSKAREIIRELADLQDTVPAVPLRALLDRIEEDFGRPADEIFEWIEGEPIGAASLAQVHRARVLASGPAAVASATAGSARRREVVVKVLRPGIEVLVETDLAAVRLATRILARWPQDSERFVKVMPQDYKRVLEAARSAREQGIDEIEAIMAAAHG